MRIWKAVGAAAVALGALTACSGVQGAGLFVGGERISEDVVDGYVDELATLQTEQGGGDLDGYDYSQERVAVVEFLVTAELGRELDLERPEGAGDDINGLYAEYTSYLGQLSQQAEPRDLTDAEFDALYEAVTNDEQVNQRVVSEWIESSGLTDAEIQQLSAASQSDPTIFEEIVRQWSAAQGAALAGLADDLNGYVEEYDITASPRYGDVAITVLPGVWEIAIPQR